MPVACRLMEREKHVFHVKKNRAFACIAMIFSVTIVDHRISQSFVITKLSMSTPGKVTPPLRGKKIIQGHITTHVP